MEAVLSAAIPMIVESLGRERVLELTLAALSQETHEGRVNRVEGDGLVVSLSIGNLTAPEGLRVGDTISVQTVVSPSTTLATRLPVRVILSYENLRGREPWSRSVKRDRRPLINSAVKGGRPTHAKSAAEKPSTDTMNAYSVLEDTK